jgi:putative secretion ATPase (PEP-CTERM system associated)
MYESFYGLKAKPFQLNPDPAFFFGSRGHKRALAYLQYGVNQNEGFLVITGEIGAGKTTLVRSLLESIDTRQFVAAQLVSTQLGASDALRSVAAAFGVRAKAREKAHLLASIEAFLTSLAIDNKRALLIVDEAQNLTMSALEELRMLSNFQLGTRALLQSFLVGQPQLRDIMKRDGLQQLRQRVIASYHLGPMEQDETRAYIEHRLKQVGWDNDPKFDKAALEAVHVITGGIPRKINLLCDRLLLSGFLAEKHEFHADDVEAVMSEIRDELGDQSSGVASTAALGDAGTPAVEAAGHALRLAEINGRLERMERTMSTALQILRALAPAAAASKSK